MRGSLIVCLGVIVLYTSCIDEPSNEIDPSLQPYVDQFFEEAQNRNLDMSPEDYSFSVKFGEKQHLGVCSTASKEILINDFYWRGFSELERQYVMFHELGHCILDRLHDNAALPNGECKSIMNALGECRENQDNYNVWRTYYLDELFDSNVPPPDWYKTQISFREAEILLEFKDSLDDRILVDLGAIDNAASIYFEAHFKDWDKSRRAVLSWTDQQIICTSSSVVITDISNDLRYLKRNVNFGSNTTIGFVRKDGFDHYLIDGQLIHMEDQQDNPLRYITVAMESPGSDIYKVPISLQVTLLE